MNSATTIGTPAAKAALQALGKRIIENSTLYHFSKSDGIPIVGNVQLPPKKQKLDTKSADKTKDEPGQARDPYLSYEQYENLLYRGKHSHHPQQAQQIPPKLADTMTESISNEHMPLDTLISDIAYDDSNSSLSSSSLSSSLQSPLTSSLPTLSSPLNSSLSSSLSSPIDPLPAPLTTISSLPQPLSPISGALTPTSSTLAMNSPSALQLIPAQGAPNTAHAVALLNSAENQKIQRKKANQQEREILEKYYDDHYVDQAVKIRKEDLTELAFTLNWHVLRVQGWMHTHRQSRSDYNPPKRTKRRATTPSEQDLLKQYFKIWTEQGLIDLHSPTRVTPKDYEVVAASIGWDNERVRRWTDHYKQKIKAAAEGNP